MAPKVAYALKEDVENQHAQLRSELGELKIDVGARVEESAQTYKAQLDALSEKVDGTANALAAAAKESGEARSLLETKLASAHDELVQLLAASEQKLRHGMADLEDKLKKFDTQVVASLSGQVDALAKRLDEEGQAHRSELKVSTESCRQQLTEAFQTAHAQLNSTVVENRTLALDSEQRLQQKLDMGLTHAGSSLAECEHRLQAAAEAESAKVQERLSELAKELEDLHHASGSHHNTASGLATELATLDDFRSRTELRLEALSTDNDCLRSAISEVENMTTRRVEWVIKDVSEKIRPSSPTNACLHRSWFSPRFNAAGLHGLQLELQYFRPTTNKGLDLQGEDAGDCAVFLWACKGTNIVYKLSVGSKVQQMEKQFNGRVPFGTRRFCWLKDQINREEDSLHVGVEILECIREVEHLIEAPAAILDNDEDNLLEGSILFHRHVNNRMLALVQQQVDLLNARMIRRVEWRIESASLLRRCFPPGYPMCSMQFAAAGLEGLQLIFYPSGHRGAQEGFCSVFLHGPAGATLKGILAVGPQRREIHHFYETPGAYGRTNFCRFEGMVEETTDTILVALEVEEAHQDSCAATAHPKVVPGDVRNQGQLEGLGQNAIESVVKVQRVPGRPGVGLETVRQLPSLWASQPISDKQVKSPGGTALGFGAGYQSFAELKGYEPTPLKLPSPWKGSAPLGSSTRSESVPAIMDKASGRSPRSSQQDGLDLVGAAGGFSSSPPRKKKGRAAKEAGALIPSQREHW